MVGDIEGDRVGSAVIGDTEGEVVGSEVIGDTDGDMVGSEVVGDAYLFPNQVLHSPSFLTRPFLKNKPKAKGRGGAVTVGFVSAPPLPVVPLQVEPWLQTRSYTVNPAFKTL